MKFNNTKDVAKLIIKFSVKQLPTYENSKRYDWVESDDVASLIRTRSLVASQVAAHKILLRVTEVDGTISEGIEALNIIPLLAVKYQLPNGIVIIRNVILKKELGYNVVASCIESLKMWRVIHQRNTGDGLISNAAYFDGQSDDWKPVILPEAVSA